MKKEKKIGTIRNKLIIRWNELAAMYGRRHCPLESFKATSIDGAQRIISNRTASNIISAEYYDCAGAKQTLEIPRQEMFRAGNK